MRSVIFIFGLLMALSNLTAGEAENEALLKQEAQKVLSEVVKDIATCEQARGKFSGLAAKDLVAKEEELIAGEDGWIIAWEYKNGVKMVANPNPLGSAATVPKVETENGILIRLFVGFEDGLARQVADRGYVLSENPRIQLRSWLLTKDEDPALRSFIEEQCRIAQSRLEPFCKGLAERKYE